MKEYKIEVSNSMLKSSDFLIKWNGENLMPLKIMYGVKLKETKGMVMMRLHGDIKARLTKRCMCCGREITNPVSQYFGIGPKCGGHNYVNPFSSEEELNQAIEAYRMKLVNTIWEGWIVKKWIESIDDDTDIYAKLAEMPIVQLSTSNPDTTANTSKPKVSVPTLWVRIDRPAKGTDDFSAFVSFKYNEQVKDYIKGLELHAWNGDTKEWEINYKDLDALILAFSNYRFDIKGKEKLPINTGIPQDYKFKTKPMKHQTEGVKYGLNHTRWLLADEMGLGKSKEVIDLGVIRKQTQGLKHCLVVCCVNSLKWNWMEEIEKHSNETGWILGMYQMKRSGKWTVGGTKEKVADLDKLLAGDAELDRHYFIITNVESLRNDEITCRLVQLCQSGAIGMVACDEAHRCKDTRTQQMQGLLQVQPEYRIAMTGTPLVNSPVDLFALLKWLGYQRYGFKSFRDHFCYLDEWGGISGYKNIDQLEKKLDSIMLRRTKKQVLPDLPDKVYMSEYVELTDEQKDLYNQIIDAVIEDPEIEDKLSLDCQLAVKLRLRQVSGGIAPFDFIKKNPKLDRMEELVEEAVYSGNKVVIFSNWQGGLAPAIKRLEKYNPLVITGETEAYDRQVIKNKFQTDDTYKVILCTIGAAGVGLTLNAASEVIFLDEPFTNAAKEQTIDRTHRIGTKSTVIVHTIMGHNTYDEDVHNIVLGKRDLSDAIVDKDALAKMRIL